MFYSYIQSLCWIRNVGGNLGGMLQVGARQKFIVIVALLPMMMMTAVQQLIRR